MMTDDTIYIFFRIHQSGMHLPTLHGGTEMCLSQRVSSHGEPCACGLRGLTSDKKVGELPDARGAGATTRGRGR